MPWEIYLTEVKDTGVHRVPGNTRQKMAEVTILYKPLHPSLPPPPGNFAFTWTSRLATGWSYDAFGVSNNDFSDYYYEDYQREDEKDPRLGQIVNKYISCLVGSEVGTKGARSRVFGAGQHPGSRCFLLWRKEAPPPATETQKDGTNGRIFFAFPADVMGDTVYFTRLSPYIMSRYSSPTCVSVKT